MRRGEAKPSDLSDALDELEVMPGEDFLVFAARNVNPRIIRGAAPQAHARSSDPNTSHQAARSVSDIRKSQLAVLSTLKRFGPMTDERLAELYEGPSQSVSGLRTRRSELMTEFDPPLVVDTGERQKLASGREAIVWAVTLDAQNVRNVQQALGL